MLRLAPRRCLMHASAWLAAVVLILPPVPHAACGCTVALQPTAVKSCCAKRLIAAQSCCAARHAQSKLCCQRNSDQAASCQCGATCQCAKKNVPDNPLAPAGQRNSETDLVMLVLVPHLTGTLANYCTSDGFTLGDTAGEFWSESALARCIFLSRFTL